MDQATLSTPPVSSRIRLSASDRKYFSESPPATPSQHTPDARRSGEANELSSEMEAAAAAAAPEEGDDAVVVLRLEAAANALFDRSAAEWVHRPDGDAASGGGNGVRVTFQHPPTAAVPRDVARFCVPPRLRHGSPSVHHFSFTDAAGVRTFAASLACIQSDKLDMLVVLCAWPVAEIGLEPFGSPEANNRSNRSNHSNDSPRLLKASAFDAIQPVP